MTTTHLVGNLHQQHIDLCLDCHRVCLETVMGALAKGREFADPIVIERLLSCAESCQMCAHMLVRNSELAIKVAALCAEFCEICAADCDRFTDDAQMHACAELCRRCAESCRGLGLADES